MKKLLPAVFIIAALIRTASAQQAFSKAYFSNNLGKTRTLCDTVYSLNIVNDTLTLLHMGASSPHQKYTVAIKGNAINLNWTALKGKPLCVTGVFEMYKKRPRIEITQPDQINLHIE